jgi:hypothetical protein
VHVAYEPVPIPMIVTFAASSGALVSVWMLYEPAWQGQTKPPKPEGISASRGLA